MSAQQKQISRKYQRICKMGADGLRHSRKKRNRYGQDKQRQKGKDTYSRPFLLSLTPRPRIKSETAAAQTKNAEKNSGSSA